MSWVLRSTLLLAVRARPCPRPSDVVRGSEPARSELQGADERQLTTGLASTIRPIESAVRSSVPRVEPHNLEVAVGGVAANGPRRDSECVGARRVTGDLIVGDAAEGDRLSLQRLLELLPAFPVGDQGPKHR